MSRLKSKSVQTIGKPTAIDLFSGCGGLTQGLKNAGFQVLGAIDVEPLSVATYRANHEEVEIWQSDIREITDTTIKRRLGLRKGKLDLLAGCPPCQGFSTMRTLNGSRLVEDPRNDLLFEFQRFVESLLPRAIMMENVVGLAQDERFSRFVTALENLGYQGEYRIINAADYGVPQRRRRLIYMAGLKVDIHFAAKCKYQRTVRDAIWGLPKAGESGDPVHDLPEKRTSKTIALIERIPKNGGSRTDLPLEAQLPCHKRCNGFKDVYGRMAWDKVAPTITSGCFNPSKGRFLHPDENRCITMREAAVLQGFPLDYRFPTTGSKSTIALMVGNALPPPLIEAHAKQILRSLSK